MQQIICNFINQLSEQPLGNNSNVCSSIMDILHLGYSEVSPIDNAFLQSKFGAIESILSSLSFEDANTLFSTVSEICAETEHLAFSAGVKVGVRLVQEISK